MTRVRIERLAHGGDGISHLSDGRVVFVPRALPGDVVEIVVERSRKRWARARIVSVVTPSPSRIPAGCPHFDVCGGCAFQHVDYAVELAEKTAAARQAFGRIAGIDVPDGEEHRASATSGYRIRARLHGDGTHVGYHAAGSHDVFDLETCPVLDPGLQAALGELTKAARGFRGELAIETAGGGELVVSLQGDATPKLLDRLAAVPGVRGVVADEVTRGEPRVDTSVALGVGVDGTVAAGRFRQSNGPMTPVLRDVVLRRVGSGDRLVELYAGSGSFTFALAPHFRSIHAWEADDEAVRTGAALARALGHGHVVFASTDLGVDVPRIGPDAVVLLDPPRTGAQMVCGALGGSRASKIVYVSCDVGTAARDARELVAGGWTLTSFDLVDMFPRTPHIEAVATFRRAT